jgi:hypothetical protein
VYDVEHATVADCLTHGLAAKVKITLGESCHKDICVRIIESDEHVNIVCEAGLAVSDGGLGSGNEITEIKALETLTKIAQ